MRFVNRWVIGLGLVLSPGWGLSAADVARAQEASTATTKAANASDAIAGDAIDKRLAPALKLLRSGKSDDGIKALTAELAKAAGDPKAHARISYYRGLAYARSGRNALAIADLTQSLYRKHLTPEQQVEALMARGQAYEAAGLKDRARRDFAEAGVSEPVVSVEAVAEPLPEPAPAPVAVAASEQEPQEAWDTVVKTKRGKVVEAAGGDADAAAPIVSAWNPDAVRAPESAAVAVGLAAEPLAAGPGAPGNAVPQASVGDFFASLFGGAPATAGTVPQAPSPSAETANIEPLAPAASGWDSTTAASELAALPSPDASAAKPRRVAAVAAAGAHSLRLAALRTPEAAEQLVARLQTEHASLLGVTPIGVAPVTLGNMGTFYEVTLGPYQDARKPAKLCAQLQAAGVDCLLITR